MDKPAAEQITHQSVFLSLWGVCATVYHLCRL